MTLYRLIEKADPISASFVGGDFSSREKAMREAEERSRENGTKISVLNYGPRDSFAVATFVAGELDRY